MNLIRDPMVCSPIAELPGLRTKALIAKYPKFLPQKILAEENCRDGKTSVHQS